LARDYSIEPTATVNINDIPLVVERVTESVLQALAGGEPTAPAVRLLLRRYAATGRDDMRDALEPALTRALDIWPQAGRDEHAGWLMLFAEAAGVSDDERLQDAMAGVASRVQASWGRGRLMAAGATGVDACLRAAGAGERVGNLQAAIDELERLVAGAYQPGEGVSMAAPGGRPRLADHVSTASALVTAFERTGRLPYSMLAEELMQFAARTLADADAPGFFDGETGAKPFALNCEAVSVLCRLAALHRSDEYRGAAVLAAGADYGRNAERILHWLAPEAPTLGLTGAVYGLAAEDLYSAL
jgi:hypothetical protein